jgi:hypothetical protein
LLFFSLFIGKIKKTQNILINNVVLIKTKENTHPDKQNGIFIQQHVHFNKIRPTTYCRAYSEKIYIQKNILNRKAKKRKKQKA